MRNFSATLAINEQVARQRAAGRELFHLGFGEAPFPVPDRLQQALAAAAGSNRYLPVQGLPALRDAALGWYCRLTSLPPRQFDVIAGPGSKSLLFSLLMALEGDVLLPTPGWVSYQPQAKLLGKSVFSIGALLDDNGYHLDADQLSDTIVKARQAGGNPRILVLNSPNNPTGLCLPDQDLEAIAEVARGHDLWVISDEIYGRITFDGRYRSIAAHLPDRTVIATGLSKFLSLGGWRLGIGLIPAGATDLMASLRAIASETWSCVAAPIQEAAVVAFQGHGDIEQHIEACVGIHRSIAAWAHGRFRAAGVSCPKPQGAFYLYPDFDGLKERLAASGVRTSGELAQKILADCDVAALPGEAFGEEPQKLTLRLALCDYDGGAALAAFQQGAVEPARFVGQCAPRVREGVDRLIHFATAC